MISSQYVNMMKSLSLPFLVLLITFDLNGQAPCNTTYYDTGGAGGNYANNQNYSTTYTAPAGSVLRITFNSFNTEAGYDYFYLYNGANTSAPLVGTYSGTSIPPVYTGTGQSLTIRFVSDASVVASGWSITFTCVSGCSNTTVGGTIVGNQTVCGSYDPTLITSSSAASGGSGTITYQWESSLNNSTWSEISGATATTYDPGTITQTTYYRRKSKTSTCTSWGTNSNTITKTVNTNATANAGEDVSQCENAAFLLIGNNPSSGFTGTWSVVSGTVYTNSNINNDSIYYTVPIGTATLRWTVTNGTCTASDDIVVTNTTGCSTLCTNPINQNGDLENEGLATNFNLTFQSTPAQLLIDNNTPAYWTEGYGTATPNTTSFTGAYYIKKTGANGNPHGGTRMVYMAGPVCYGPMNTSLNVACGRTFRVTAWVAAYSNNTTQSNAPFALEAFINDWENVNPTIVRSYNLIAPASTSWNSLNWVRYSFDVSVPTTGYEHINIVFSTSDNVNGIVFDDVCINEITTGSYSLAGNDQSSCANSFTMAANTAPAGYTGTWSVVSGNASFSNVNSPTATATLTSGTSATIRWTISNGGACSHSDDVTVAYAANPLSVNNATICSGGSATLTANGCSGNLLWSTGATTPSITVSPSSTSTYSVNCTSALGSNIVLNPGLESATNMENWSNWQNTSITTVAGEVYANSKALKINASGSWAGCGQDVAITGGSKYNFSFYAKTNNLGENNYGRIIYYNSSYVEIGRPQYIVINTLNYSSYNIVSVAPPNAAYAQISFESGGTAILYIDEIAFRPSAVCSGTATATVTVTTSVVTLGSAVVSAVINHPLQDVVTVDVPVSWSNAPSGEDIYVKLDDKIETISVSTGATSPQTIQFIVPATNTTKTITATWSGNTNLNSVDFINGFQMMSEGNTTVSGSVHIHGPVAIGGNIITNGPAEINMDAVGSYTFPGDNNTTGLLVKNGVTWNSGLVKILNSKLIHIQSSTGSSSGDNGNNSFTQVYPSSSSYNNANRIEGSIDQTPSPAVFQTVSFDFAAKYVELRNYATDINAKNNNITLINSSTNAAIPGNTITSSTNVKITNLSSTEVNYLNISSSSLGNITEFKFEGSGFPSATKVLVINVAVSSNFAWNNPNFPGIGSAHSPYILWNFYTTSTYNLTFNNSNLFIGSILAPNLNFIKTGTNDIDGQIIAKTIQVGTGELHYFPFSGEIISPVGCSPSVTAIIPAAISNDEIGCNILYLCGQDKPSDGDAWDHGFINYLDEVSTGTILPILTKPDASGLGTYNPESPSTFVTVNLNNYKLIVISPTTQGFLSADMKNALANYTGGILNLNYESTDDLGMTNGNAFYNFQNNAYINASSQINIYNYDNVNPSFSLVLTGGNMNARGVGSLWFGAGNSNTMNNAVLFEYQAHSIVGQSSTQGKRVYLGFHPNGIYDNAQNGGAIPAPASSYFHPTKHLTLEAKAYLDQAIVDASACTTELCVNGIDDDGDGLADCYDPDCTFLNNGEFDNSTTDWSFYNNASGNTATYTIDNTSQLTGKNSARINITAATGTDWHLQLAQSGKTIESGKKYTLSFRAKAAASRNMTTTIDLGSSPYTAYFSTTTALTTTAQTYTYTFTASATVNNNIRVIFNLAATTGTIYIDQISFREACDEICNNGLDDDGDNLIDALDPKCNNCAFIGQNLVANGEFDAGNTGFTSDYIYTPITNMCGNYGIYSVGSRISQVGAPNGCNIPIWAVNDRANTGGNFMLIDPSAATGVNDRIWAQTITVCPNTDYVFSVWTKNMYYAEAGGYSGVDPNFQFKINGTTLPDANFIMPRQARIDSTTWIKVQGTWNSGSATSAVLNIVNKIPGAFGNDLALDGIFFGLCGKTVDITSSTTSFCTGSSLVLSATAQTISSGWQFYEWLKNGVVVASGTNATTYTATTAGTYKLRTYYTTPDNTGCPTESNSITLTVIPRPTISNPSPISLCIGATANITPNSGGTWTSNNTSVATISNTGLITAVGAGTATFTFTQTSNGCQSDASSILTVNARPSVSITGSSSICIGSTTTLSPTTGGTWMSSNTSIATVNNAGVVTGVAAGTATFTFTHSTTNCVSLATNLVTINVKPSVSITGATTICAGSTTTLSPTTGGTWVSNNTSVATVTNGGVVTGVSGGTATFTFTNSTTLCPSDATSNVTVNARPTTNITGSNTSLCIGNTTTVSPTTSGTWVSSNTSVATITNGGVITAISAGTSTFTYTLTSNGCSSLATAPFTVNVKPSVSITGSATICEGSTTTLSPTTGGTWVSNNTSVATVTNGGVVTGVSGGTSTFTFTNSTTLCPSDATSNVTVNARPTTNITGSNTSLCIGNTTTVSPTTSGTWVSSNTSVATITNGGVITAVSAGTSTFTYTLTSNGCSSLATAPFTVNVKPSVSITGSATICEGSTTTLSPTTGGTWVSNNTSVATVTNGGVVTGVSGGTATFTFTNSTTLCPSDATSNVTVNARPTTNITGSNTSLCIGNTTTVSPTTSGTWVSSNTSVATITNGGVITAVSAGTSTFTYTLTSNGCSSLATAPFTVNVKPSVSITGSATICEGSTTTLSPTTGGTWVSNNTSVATVTNGGVVTGVSGGTSTFTFTNSTTLCPSDATSNVTVNARPTTNITGSNTSLCIGNTTTVSPTTSGTWVSSNTSVATITNGGVITAVSAGTSTFTYTLTSNGCSSLATAPFTVNVKPSVSITGSATICEGSTTTLSPTTGGTWVSNNTSVATVTNGGVVTGVSGGTATFTFTNSTTLCPSDATSNVTVNARPTTNITGSNTSLCIGNTTTVSPTTSGTWVSSNTSVATITNGGVITAVSAGTSTFTYTLTSNGCSSLATAPFTVNVKPSVSITGSATICEGSTTTLSPTTGGTWVSNNTSVATVTNGGVVTGVSGGTATFTFTNSTSLCPSDATSVVTIISKPTITNNGEAKLCIGANTNLSPSSGGTWTSSNPSVASVNNAGLVQALNAGTSVLSFTNATGCISANNLTIDVGQPFTTTIDYNGSVCLTNNKTLEAISNGGTAPYVYQWTGPSSFAATSKIINITNNGNYYLTISDSYGCISNTSGFVYAAFEPLIVSLNTQVCEGQTLVLNASGSSAVSYLWSSNANDATTASVTVTPAYPASTYHVTVTNNLGCTAVATANINVIAKPTISVTGPTTICEGFTSALSPSTGGNWVSNNAGVAVVDNNGIVYGVGGGSTNFVFTNSTTGCSSDASANITVNPRPVVTLIGPSTVCIESTTNFEPSTGGTWVSNNPSVATINNNGLVTAISGGNASFVFTNALNCPSNNSININIDVKDPATLTGLSSVCVGSNIQLATDKNGGTWSSEDLTIATINNLGVLTGVSAGNVTIKYSHYSGACLNEKSKTITVYANPVVSITGEDTICVGSTTQLNPASGGMWISNDQSVATIDNNGLVTAIDAGNVSFIFTQTSTGCVSPSSNVVHIDALPIVDFSGNGNLCIGQQISISPSSGGTWISDDESIATIDASGLVTALSGGSVVMTYTELSTGCSNSADTIHVSPTLSAAIDYNGSICLTNSSVLSALPSGGTSPFQYMWAGPSSFFATTKDISINTNGNYYLTITDAFGCNISQSAFVYEKFEPIFVGLQSQICEGQQVNLSVNGNNVSSYLWSSNAGYSTQQNVTVTPTVPSSSYSVTVTNAIGCTASLVANINVSAKPIISLNGSGSICIGTTTQFTPSTNGIWVSTNPTYASITSAGLVTGIAAGSSTFYYTQSSTGCTSIESLPITVQPKPQVSIAGTNTLCIGATTSLSPSTQGTWTSSNPAIATVANNGLVTAISDGIVTFNYTSSVTNCVSDATTPITINPKPNVLINGPSSVCVGFTTNVSPGYGGTWVSNNPSVATVNNAGLVTGISAGSTSFVYSETNGCISDPTTDITIKPKPTISFSGPTSICIASTSNMLPNTGGIWTSSNNTVATISNVGLITGISAGTAKFTFTNSTTGCISLESTPLEVKPNPVIALNGPSTICIGASTNFTPSTGGTWSSNNPTIASISNAGVVTGISQGLSTFRFTNTSGCQSANSVNITINAKPTTILLGDPDICIGGTTQFFPQSGGTWSSNNPSIAVINNSGEVLGISQGSTTFKFTDNNTTCTSSNTSPINVLDPVNIGFTGPNHICVGATTSLFPTFGGTWISNNPSIATVSSNGEITAISPGLVSFSFTNSISGCQAVTTTPLTVNPKPAISPTGPLGICLGNTSSISPTTGGIWVSNNPSVASVTNNGIITALTSGNTTFKFTDTITGCTSLNSQNFSIYNKPVVSISGSTSICVGTSTTLHPSSGGTWVSNNPSILSATNSGVVVGLSAGTGTLKYTEAATGCESENTLPITVNPKPIVTISGPSNICIYGTTNLLPASGGSWSSSNNVVATVTNAGLITALNQGLVSFNFTSLQGCVSEATNLITVHGRPSVSIAGSSSICIGTTTQLLPSSGGTWTSSNAAVATISNTGLVTGVSTGTATFTFVDASTGCASLASSPITINSNPVASINGSSAICIGSTSQLLPSSGGVWISSNPALATINNNGLVTGVDAGIVNFTYTNTNTGCSTNGNLAITINPRPVVVLSGPSNICIGTTTAMTSSGAGTWSSKNPTIASISANGTVMGLSSGTAKFTFTSAATGCVSLQSSAITVNPKPSVLILGSSQICLGGTSLASPTSGGTWVSNNPSIATINNSGVINAVGLGTATFVFTETSSGCTSLNTSVVNVTNPANVSVSGLSKICIDQTTTLEPSTGGVWTSSNAFIATVNNQGLVKGKAPGKVTFTFTDSNNGCISELPIDAVNVISCIDPDINITSVNQIVIGNVNTNDDVPLLPNSTTGVSYSMQPLLLSKPSNSIATLNMNSDGSYDFTANEPGQYIYNVGLCYPSSSCTFSNLTLTVVDDKDVGEKMVANTDIISTYRDSLYDVNTMTNDKCINAVTCNLVNQQWSLTRQGGFGLMTEKPNGWSKYVPNPLFIGIDTVEYKICAMNSTTNCKNAMQLITVKHPSAINSTVGADDFFAAYQDTIIVGNALANDSDPEKNGQTIDPQGSISNPIVISQGSYSLASNGDFKFTPASGFYGPVDIVYNVCDDHPTDQSCTKATIHLLIIKDITIKLRVYLEGSLVESNSYSSSGKPLMRDGLRNNIFDGKNHIPVLNPYKIPSNEINITNNFNTILFGNQSQFDTIPDSLIVFSVTGENAIVDWVFVELRDKNNYLDKLSCRAALLQRDGDVVDIDGVSDVKFPRLNADSFYVVIRHRNHLGAMSMKVSNSDIVDFTKISTELFDFGVVGQNNMDYSGLATNNFVSPGYRALWAGDFDADGKLKFTNPGDDQNTLFFDVFAHLGNVSGNANYNFTIGYYQGDYNMNGKSKYDNPDDDKNLLFSQILLYPLNEQFLSNFNFFIEQVPKN